MRYGQREVGAPYVQYTNTKAAIEALTGMVEGAVAEATDTHEFGYYNGSAWVWSNTSPIHDHSSATTGGTTLQVDKDTYRFGFVTDYSGAQQTTIAFDGINTFTIAPLAPRTTWEYYRNGIKYTITGSKTVTLSGSPPAAKGLYYIYIDADDGTLTASTVGWTLEDTKVCVSTIAWDNALTPKYWIQNERHSVAIDRRYHFEHHFADGTEIIAAPVLSGYTVSPAVPSDVNNTFGISLTIVADEDIKHTLSALTDPNGTATDYVVMYRNGAGVWNWEASAMPYRYTAAGYIQYDNAGTMTQGQAAKFYTSYLLITNMNDAARFVFINGQAEFSTLAAAHAESFSALIKTGLPIAEYIAVYQLIWSTNASYGTKGKCRMADTPEAIIVSASGASTPVSQDHEALTGLLGGATNDHYHLTSAEGGLLIGGADTTLHYHAADRALDNATVTSVASAAFNEAARTAADWVMIADSGIIGAGGSSTIDFTSIPATYKHLRLILSLRTDAVATSELVRLRFNNDSGANKYDRLLTYLYSTSTLFTGETLAETSTVCGTAAAASAVASDFAKYVVDIPDYANTGINKDLVSVGIWRGSAGSGDIRSVTASGHWRDTAAINRITLFPNTGTNKFVQYSRATLYGVK